MPRAAPIIGSVPCVMAKRRARIREKLPISGIIISYYKLIIIHGLRDAALAFVMLIETIFIVPRKLFVPWLPVPKRLRLPVAYNFHRVWLALHRLQKYRY